ncbi:MAG: S1C family serine protease [Phycisphaerae bacterium]
MHELVLRPVVKRFRAVVLAAGLAAAVGGTLQVAPAQARPADARVPTSLAELRDLERRVERTVARVMPAVVAIRGGVGGGSGVIITEDGLVLTAGHVIGAPERFVTLTLADGREVRGRTLGVSRRSDAGMVQITDPGPFPFVKRGTSNALERGQWLLALGHPGGLQEGRPAVLRLGRVLANRPLGIVTDNTLVGGDSGGPLFDLAGNLVGIHSRIGAVLVQNVHVPIDRFDEEWDRLAAGEAFGVREMARAPEASGSYLGIEIEQTETGIRVAAVVPGFAAEEAGLQPGDLIEAVGDEEIGSLPKLLAVLNFLHKPGDEVKLTVRRGPGQVLRLNATLAERP